MSPVWSTVMTELSLLCHTGGTNANVVFFKTTIAVAVAVVGNLELVVLDK